MNLSKSYHQIFPSRINPEFIGVSSIYSEHKNHRKTEQSKKQSLQSSRLYIQNLDRNLQKTIYSKSVELNRLQSSRDRRLQQAKNKSQRDQMRKNEIDKLKQMNNKRRQELKKKLQKSRSQLYTQNRQGWRQLKSSLSQNHQIKNENLMQQLTINIHKKLSVKQGQSAAIDKINTFHRRKNTENLQAYMRRIKLQNRLKRLNQDKSKKLKLDVNRLNKTIYLKKNYLLCLQSEIGKFKTDIYSFNKTQLSRAKKNQQQQQQAKMYTNKSFQKFYKKETHK